MATNKNEAYGRLTQKAYDSGESIMNPPVVSVPANGRTTLNMHTGELNAGNNADGTKKPGSITKLVIIEKTTPEPPRTSAVNSNNCFTLRGLNWYGPDVPSTPDEDKKLLESIEKSKRPYNDYFGGWMDKEKTALLVRNVHDASNIAHDISSNYNNRSEKMVADTIFLHYTAGSGNGLGDASNLANCVGATSHFVTTRNGRIIQLFELGRRVFTEGYFISDAPSYAAPERSIIGRYRRKNKLAAVPGMYGYSIENASADGSLEDCQLEALVYLLRFIRKEVEDGIGHRIKFNRLWREFPDRPPLNTDDNTYYHSDVYGFLVGHNEVGQTACPGKEFPWLEILEKLGVYPKKYTDMGSGIAAYTQELTKLRKETAKFYAAMDAYLENEEGYLAANKENPKEFPLSTMADVIGPRPKVPYYNEIGFQEDQVEFLVWERPLADIVDASKYDVTALRKDFIENSTQGGKKKYPAGTYKIMGVDD